MTNKFYWESVYKHNRAPIAQSSFAQYVLSSYIHPDDKIIELGCGNGRDAIYFAQNNIQVVAVDQCSSEIERLKTSNRLDNLVFMIADFTHLDQSNEAYDLIYSRFTLHSVDKLGQSRVINWSYNSLKPKGKICIEARGYKNALYKKGKAVTGQKDAFIFNDHYRRFINIDKLVEELVAIGFKILIANEERGFAPISDFDDYFIRVIAQK
ncbi:class I SAM-dependent methyltransferase [bacterium]|nr:class I SAM-dependent methyltransferase [bacterium]